MRCSLTLIRRVHLRSSSRPIHGDIWPPSIIHWEFLTNLTIVLNEQILLIFCADFLPHVSYIKQNQQQFLWEKNILRKGNNPLRTCWWLSGQVILGKMQKKAHHHHYQQHHQHLHCHQHHHRSWKYLYCVPFHKRIPNWNKHVKYQNRRLCYISIVRNCVCFCNSGPCKCKFCNLNIAHTSSKAQWRKVRCMVFCHSVPCQFCNVNITHTKTHQAEKLRRKRCKVWSNAFHILRFQI